MSSRWKELVTLGLQPESVCLGPKEYLQAEIEINQAQKLDPSVVYKMLETGTCQIESPIYGKLVLHLIGTSGIHFEFKRGDLPRIAGP